MIITRKEKWYRPYIVEVNGRDYKLDKIHFYKDGKITVSSNSGWLETEHSRDISELVIPTEEILLRRKEKFDGKVFIMSAKNCFGESVAQLYIPSDMLDIHFVEHRIEYGHQVRAIYKGEQGIHISHYVKQLNEHLNELRSEYEETYKRVSDTHLSINDFGTVLADIEKLKQLAEAYNTERIRLKNLTIADINTEELRDNA